MLTIVPDPPTPTNQPEPRRVPLLLVETDLPDDVAVLAGHTLRVDASASEAEQLAAISDAIRHLWTGRSLRGQRVNHLRPVTA